MRLLLIDLCAERVLSHVEGVGYCVSGQEDAALAVMMRDRHRLPDHEKIRAYLAVRGEKASLLELANLAAA
jgi:hypothetical protein